MVVVLKSGVLSFIPILFNAILKNLSIINFKKRNLIFLS